MAKELADFQMSKMKKSVHENSKSSNIFAKKDSPKGVLSNKKKRNLFISENAAILDEEDGIPEENLEIQNANVVSSV